MPESNQKVVIDVIEINENVDEHEVANDTNDELMTNNDRTGERIELLSDSKSDGEISLRKQRHLPQNFQNTRMMTSQLSKSESANSNTQERGIIKKVTRDKIKVKSPIKNIKNALKMDKSSPKSGLKRSLRGGLGLKSQPSQNLDKDRSSNIKGRVQNLILNFDKNMHEKPKKRSYFT